MLDQYVAAGGTVIDTGRFYGANKDGEHACESERVLKNGLILVIIAIN